MAGTTELDKFANLCAVLKILAIILVCTKTPNKAR